MNFAGSTHSQESTYFEEKVERARNKLKEFPTLQEVLENFNLANRENHTENALLNILGMFGSEYTSQESKLKYEFVLKEMDNLLKDLLKNLSKEKRNNLIRRLNIFGENNFELMNELEFCVELRTNKKLSDVHYENLNKGNHDFNLKIEGEEFNIEVTSLGKSQIQQIVEEAFNLASKEIFSAIPKKVYLQIEVVTDRILKEENNKVVEIKSRIMEDYEKLKDLIWVNKNGLCILGKNLGDPTKSLYEIKDIFEYYQEFGQRLSQLLLNNEGVSFLKKTQIKDITESSIISFIIGNAKFGAVEIHSQCSHPSNSEDLRKKSLINQLKRRIKDKIVLGQLKGKKNPMIAIRFEDFSFMHYSSDSDIWWEENGKELKGIVESVFKETKNKEILGVLLYENSIKQSKFFQNPNRLADENLFKKIEVLKN